jgi:hypothetical protein
MNLVLLALLTWVFIFGLISLAISPLIGILLCVGSVWVAAKLDL